MEAVNAFAEHDPIRLRPVAHWVQQQDSDGRARLTMVWSVPDVQAAATALLTAEA